MKQQILQLIDSKMTEIPSRYNFINTILQELRKEIEEIEEWIPVTDRLPEDGVNVWVYSPNRKREDQSMFPYSVGVYHSQGGWMDIPLKGGFYIDLEPTHWQPLTPPTNQ